MDIIQLPILLRLNRICLSTQSRLFSGGNHDQIEVVNEFDLIKHISLINQQKSLLIRRAAVFAVSELGNYKTDVTSERKYLLMLCDNSQFRD